MRRDQAKEPCAMILSQNRAGRRPAFTLVELLIAIVVIGVLAGLTTAAVNRGWLVSKRAKNRIDIGQLEIALGQFQKKFGRYPPSYFILCEKYQDYQMVMQ